MILYFIFHIKAKIPTIYINKIKVWGKIFPNLCITEVINAIYINKITHVNSYILKMFSIKTSDNL